MNSRGFNIDKFRLKHGVKIKARGIVIYKNIYSKVIRAVSDDVLKIQVPSIGVVKAHFNELNFVDQNDESTMMLKKNSKYDIFEFDVYPEGRFVSYTEQKGIKCTYNGCYLVFFCPKCSCLINHGGNADKPGSCDGPRVPHCPCWKGNYYIKEIVPYINV